MDIGKALANLSVKQKARMLAGADFWHTMPLDEVKAPSVALADGPNGLRKQVEGTDHLGLAESVPATCFPAACATACSFDESLLKDIGRALGEECRDQGVACVLGPGVNIKRHPLGGRSFEYLSEDPLLAGSLAAAFVEGVQSTGAGACVKHFAANSQETARMVSDSVVDERALREVYLRPFELVVRRARPRFVMTAYNRLNGAYCSQNERLLDEVLRSEWGFAGAAVTDWGALSESVPSVAAGLDLVMPGPRADHASAIEKAVRCGKLSEGKLDSAVARVLRFAADSAEGSTRPFTCDYERHLALAARAAEESAVLLENDGTLPFSPDARIAIIGAFARCPRYQGAGSSRVNPVALDAPLEALQAAGADVAYAPGFDGATGRATEDQIADAAALAASCDAAAVFVGQPVASESEGSDRTTMSLPDDVARLIARVCEANPRTAVVLYGGGALELPWRASSAPDGPSAPCRPGAALMMHLPGCQGGQAVARLLFGQANPCGKLAETWPRSVSDTALGTAFPDRSPTREILYRESVFVGYRYYDAAGIEVAFPFGHGLSYTTFSYSDLRIEPSDGCFTVSFSVANAGKRDGTETAQVYVAPKSPAAFRPKQELAAFAKVRLRAGERTRIELALGPRAFSWWDRAAHAWRADAGAYEIRVGASSRDVRLCTVVSLADNAPFPVADPPSTDPAYRLALSPYYNVTAHGFTDKAFRALYGRPLPVPAPKRPFTPDSPIGDMQATALGRVMRAVIARAGSALSGSESASTIFSATMDEIPLRSFTMGGLSLERVCGLVDVLNGHPIRGLGRLLRG